MGRVVAVVGALGRIGTCLADHLRQDGSISRVVAVGIEPNAGDAKIVAALPDVGRHALDDTFDGVDAVVWVGSENVDARKNAPAVRMSVRRFEAMLESIDRSSVDQLVYMSSVRAYGAHPDNPVRLSEEMPLRPNFKYRYGEQTAYTEAVLERWTASHSGVDVTILRPATVVGAGGENPLERAIRAKRIVTVRGFDPGVQVVHVSDFVEALGFFLRGRIAGAFNVCPSDSLGWREFRRLTGAKTVALPRDVALIGAEIGWRVGASRMPPIEIVYRMFPALMSNEAARLAGWTAARSSSAALMGR